MTSPHHHPSYPPPSPHSTPTPTPQARYAPPPPPPPPFSPFFTLISTPHTTAHKHPIVHYIFADDDIDPTLPSDPNPNPSQNQNPNPPSTDRVIIVDVGATTTDVSAVSLSHDWQVLGVKIEAAPQWAGETAGGGLMLTVEGTDANVVQKRGERERGMGMEELAEVYGERMALLKRVVEFGGGGGAQTA